MTRDRDLPAGDALDDLVDLCLHGEAWPDKIASHYNAKGKRTPLNRYSRDDHAATELIQFFIDGYKGHTTCTMSVCSDRGNRVSGVRWDVVIAHEFEGEAFFGSGNGETYALAIARAFVDLFADKE
jgi:hypothetical protein